MQNIQSVTFILENCEYISFSANELSMLNILDIRRTITLRNGRTNTGLKADEVFIKINANANIPSADLKCSTENSLPFTRLMEWNDITYLELMYTDKSSESISTYWHEDDCENNRYQTSMIHDCDNDLCILISPTEKVESYLK